MQLGNSSDRKLVTSVQWPAVLRPLTQLAELPAQVLERYSTVQTVCFCGVFPQIRRAWASVDNTLFLWRLDRWCAPLPPLSQCATICVPESRTPALLPPQAAALPASRVSPRASGFGELCSSCSWQIASHRQLESRFTMQMMQGHLMHVVVLRVQFCSLLCAVAGTTCQ